MALTATIHNFDIELADTDRHVYESLALRLARHPSESEEYFVARLIAYLLEFAEGIEFSRGDLEPGGADHRRSRSDRCDHNLDRHRHP